MLNVRRASIVYIFNNSQRIKTNRCLLRLLRDSPDQGSGSSISASIERGWVTFFVKVIKRRRARLVRCLLQRIPYQ